MSLTGWNFDDNGTTGYPLAADSYREMDASGEANFGEDNAEARRVLITNWDTNTDFVAALLGYAEYTGAGTGVHRVPPDPHPELNWLYAMTARRSPVTPSSVNGNVSNWTMAKFDASYRGVDYYPFDDNPFEPNELYRFVSRKTIPKGDYLQLAVNAFSWKFAGGNLGSVPGIIVPSKTLEYTWHMVPSKTGMGFGANQELRCPVENTILALLGSTNSNTFDSVYATGTVLFVAAEATLIPPKVNGLYHWNIKYFFEQKDHGPNQDNTERNGVNYIFNTVTNKWDCPQLQGSVFPNGRLYQYADLNQLFVLNAGS
jgi:hypothetical protein